MACWSFDRGENWPGSLSCGFKQVTLLLPQFLSQSIFINERVPADLLGGGGGYSCDGPARYPERESGNTSNCCFNNATESGIGSGGLKHLSLRRHNLSRYCACNDVKVVMPYH